MQKSYKCPQCGKDVLYITNPCPNCKLRLDWRQQPPIPYIPPGGAPQQQVIQPEIVSHQSIINPHNDWDRQLPSHIARNEQVWWQTFPRIKSELPPKLLQVFGGAKESPSREIIGKVILVAEIRAELRAKFGNVGGSLLNHWGCYCNKMMDGLEMGYLAGTETNPMLTFNVASVVLSVIMLRFYGKIEKDSSIRDALQKTEEMQLEMVKEAGREIQLQETKIEVVSFKHGHWENGLETAFRAAVWVCSNREEALKNIWKIRNS